MLKQNNIFLPFEVVFHPDWWHRNYNINFTEDYFFDPKKRVEVELLHRQVMHERFGGDWSDTGQLTPKPVMGPVHLAAGYLVSAVLGCQLRFVKNSAPEIIPKNMSDEEVLALKVPDITISEPMNKVINLMDQLEDEFGYVEGDINWQGLLNVALDLRGQQFLMDYHLNPPLARRLLDVIYETTINIVNTIKNRTGTSSTSVNRIAHLVNPLLNVHSNCSVTMIPVELYNEFHLPYENKLSKELEPYGIHHCGNDMHRFADTYATTNAVFFDVGWGSDIAACRAALPDAILSLRMDPVLMEQWSVKEVKTELERCLNEAGPLDKTAVCCINMGHAVPDENVFAMISVIDKYRETNLKSIA